MPQLGYGFAVVIFLAGCVLASNFWPDLNSRYDTEDQIQIMMSVGSIFGGTILAIIVALLARITDMLEDIRALGDRAEARTRSQDESLMACAVPLLNIDTQ